MLILLGHVLSNGTPYDITLTNSNTGSVLTIGPNGQCSATGTFTDIDINHGAGGGIIDECTVRLTRSGVLRIIDANYGIASAEVSQDVYAPYVAICTEDGSQIGVCSL